VGALPAGNYVVGIEDPGMTNIHRRTNVSPSTAAVPPETTLSTGQTQPSTTPATRQPNRAVVPTAGGANGTMSSPTDGRSVEHVERNQVNRALVTSKNSPAKSAPFKEVGILTVDESGTGRMQQTVEGVRVRHVVGQSIVIISQANETQTLPPTPNSAGAKVYDRAAIASSTSNMRNHNIVANSAHRTDAADQVSSRSRIPVAAGIIRLISDRRPPATAKDEVDSATSSGESAARKPSSATPSTSRNVVR